MPPGAAPAPVIAPEIIAVILIVATVHTFIPEGEIAEAMKIRKTKHS
jgi:hypothetical protein